MQACGALGFAYMAYSRQTWAVSACPPEAGQHGAEVSAARKHHCRAAAGSRHGQRRCCRGGHGGDAAGDTPGHSLWAVQRVQWVCGTIRPGDIPASGEHCPSHPLLPPRPGLSQSSCSIQLLQLVLWFVFSSLRRLLETCLFSSPAPFNLSLPSLRLTEFPAQQL